jgi:hypothetical protein
MLLARSLPALTLVFACWLIGAGDSAAQGTETVGVRALGMGGAFTAVADDATATWWNPAGLATGAIFSGVFEHARQTIGDQHAPAFANARAGTATFVGFAAPPVGLSYYHVRTTRLVGDRATTLVTDHAGVTFVQSIGQYLDVAATVKYVHGNAGIAIRDASFVGSSALDRAADLPTQGSSTIDFDLGALAQVGHLRAGLVIRNLREPSFDAPASAQAADGPGSLTLDRQVRAGVAWQFPHSMTVAGDVDVTKTESELGVRRHVAVGAEHQLHPRFVIRGGVRVNTVGDALPAGSAGASVALRSSLWLDAQITRGGDAADRGWGLSARVGF